jgi:hypothetical protein
MTAEELKIGAEWLAILNAHSNDFGTKSLFNNTAAYLKAKHSGQKRVSKFQKEIKGNATVLTQDVKAPEKRYSLLDAAKIREQNIEKEYEEAEFASNLLLTSETDEFETVKRKSKRNV